MIELLDLGSGRRDDWHLCGDSSWFPFCFWTWAL